MVLAALCGLFVPAAAHSDVSIVQETSYEAKRGQEIQRTVDHRYWIAPRRARLQQENELYLLDTEAGDLYYVDLGKGHFDRHPSPNTLENIVPAVHLEEARMQFEEQMPRRVEVTRTGETETIAGYEAERVVIEAGGPGEPVTARFELWMSHELWKALEGTAYWALERDRLSMSPYTAWLVEPLRELEAVPVKKSVVMFLGDGRMKTEYTTTVRSVEREADPPDGVYRLPEGVTPFPPPEPVRVPP
jgi:hypothetical protein